MRPVEERPKLPQAFPQTIEGLVAAFEDLVKQLTRLYTNYGFNINNMPIREIRETTISPVPANGATATWTHSMMFVPRIYQVEIVCTTAEGNFEVGDTVPIAAGRSAGGAGVLISVPSSNGDNELLYGIGTNGIVVLNETTLADFTITNANWDLVLRVMSG